MLEHLIELDDPDSFDTSDDVFTTPYFGGGEQFPGAPSHYMGTPIPPTDALGFYLPFHFFHPVWWGVYLTVEGVLWLARHIRRKAPHLPTHKCLTASKMFIYNHEVFHHNVECYATRLEITHRKPLYRTGFVSLYGQTYGTDRCLEEALANAWGYHKVRSSNNFPKRGGSDHQDVCDALRRLIQNSPAGYRMAKNYLGKNQFYSARDDLAELYHAHSLSSVPTLNAKVWASFPYAFSGISRITSRVNYIIHQHSPLAIRSRLGRRYLSYKELKKRLEKLANCQKVRGGKGSHERWQTPEGTHFTAPKHPRDLKKGTLRRIIRDAGLPLSNSEFIQTQV